MCFFVGCGPKKNPSVNSSSTVADTAAKAKEEANRRIIESGKLTLEANDENGNPSWTLNGESSRAGIQDSGDNEFYIQDVAGKIYQEGKVASTFLAETAKAVSETKKLVLDGNVKITSLAQKLTLKADKITWMEDKQLFAASGNVQIDSPDYHLGDMDEVWATPDLDKIGTPNKFK